MGSQHQFRTFCRRAFQQACVAVDDDMRVSKGRGNNDSIIILDQSAAFLPRQIVGEDNSLMRRAVMHR